MYVLGLTGSIGMGKSTAASLFRRLGYKVHDADAVVHLLLSKGGAAVKPIQEFFPNVVENGSVDRGKLGAAVFENAEALQQLEKIVHPLVARERDHFLKRALCERARLVVLDIPLLFETGGDAGCDAIAVVSAPTFVQTARVLARPSVDQKRLDAIRAKQLPDRAKRRLADFVIQAGAGKRRAYADIRHLCRVLLEKRGKGAWGGKGAWPPKPGTPFGREKGWCKRSKRPTILPHLRRV